MKKFFTLILVLAAALTASATTVNIAGTFSKWSPAWSQQEMIENDGVFSLNVGDISANTEFKLIIDGEWYGNSGLSVAINTKTNYWKDKDKGNCKLANAANNVVAYYEPSTNMFWYEGDTDVENEYYVFYEANNNWDFANNQILMTKNSDGKYEAEIPENINYFGLSMGKMTGWGTATRFCPTTENDVNVSSETARYSFKSASNGAWKPALNKAFTIVADFDNNYFTVKGGEVVVSDKYYVYTATNDVWNYNDPIEFAEGGDGGLVASIPANTNLFTITKGQITDFDNLGDAVRYFPESQETINAVNGQTYNYTTVNNNLVWRKSNTEIEITLAPEANTFSLTFDEVQVGEKLYILGSGISGVTSWTPNSGLEGKYYDNLSTALVSNFQGFAFYDVQLEEGNQFNFAPKLGANGNDWDATKPRITPASGNYTFQNQLTGNDSDSVEYGYDQRDSHGEYCFSAPAGKYIILVSTKDGDHKITLFNANTVTGVEEIEFDANQPAVYYNLQGMEVANPSNGLYIVRQGNKTFKLYVR